MDEPVRWYKTPDGDWMRQITESDRIVGWEADEKGTHAKERAVLMGIESLESLDELARLADTAGAEVVGQFLQRRISRIRRCSSGAGARMNCAGSVRRWKLICAFLTRN